MLKNDLEMKEKEIKRYVKVVQSIFRDIESKLLVFENPVEQKSLILEKNCSILFYVFCFSPRK